MPKVRLTRDFAEFKKGDEVEVGAARAERLKQAGAIETASLSNAGESPTKADALKGIEFASQAAEDAALEANLTKTDFKGTKPSGVNGYTKADVTEVAEKAGK